MICDSLVIPDNSKNRVALIGDPINHSLSPRMQNRAFARAQLNWFYHGIQVKKGDAEKAIKWLKTSGYKGLNITMPLKEEAFFCCDEIKGVARYSKSINTIKFQDDRTVGYNTDIGGFESALQYLGMQAEKGVMIFGAGAVAKIVAISAFAKWKKPLFIIARDREKAKVLEVDLKATFPEICVKIIDFVQVADMTDTIDPAGATEITNIIDAFSRIDLFVNATPCGMGHRTKLPKKIFDLIAVGPGNFFDMVYDDREPEIVTAVKNRGGKACDGRFHLVFQGALSFEIWTGLRPHIPSMMEAVKIKV